MKPRISSCCWCATLRSGCIIIGWFSIVMGIISFLNLLMEPGDHFLPFDDGTKKFMYEFGIYIGVPEVLLYLIAGTLVIIGVHKMIPYILRLAVFVMLFKATLNFSLALWTLVVDTVSSVIFVNYLLSCVLDLYFILVLESYCDDVKQLLASQLQPTTNVESRAMR